MQHPTPFLTRAIALSSLLGVLASAFISATRAQTAPTVSYTPEAGARQLLFVNNPEKLELSYTDRYTYVNNGVTTPSATQGVTFNDLADPGKGQKAIFQATLPPGSYRDIFEHVFVGTADYVPPQGGNTLPAAAPANYAVQIYNPNAAPITVALVGKSLRTGFLGGQPLADVLNAEQGGSAPVTYTLPAYRVVWLLRSDVDYAGTRPINQGSFFSGVIDFDVSGGSCVVTNIAYQNLRALTRWTDMGFIPRCYASGAPESRVYKGLMAYPSQTASPGSVVAHLPFTVTSATAKGELPVTYPQYVSDGSGNYAPSATAAVSATFWQTHNIPSRNASVAASDMYNLLMPGFGTVYALSPTPAPNTPLTAANIANWGITYHDALTITNNDTRPRTFALTLNNFSTDRKSVV